jgi:8-hydroxy-5-deazaflavin:NADPH oxidoreductase
VTGSVRRLAVVGAGKLGMTVARIAAEAGLEVAVSSSGGVDELAFTVSFLAPGASAKITADAVRDADVVVLAVPFHRFRSIPAELLDARVVVDAMNYWEAVDGVLADEDVTTEESSLLVQRWFAGARVVRTLNQLGYHDLEELRRPHGAPDRVAQAVAGDDPLARARAAELLDRLGFDAVDAGPLEASRRLGPGTAAFGAAYDAGTLRALISPSLEDSATAGLEAAVRVR